MSEPAQHVTSHFEFRFAIVCQDRVTYLRQKNTWIDRRVEVRGSDSEGAARAVATAMAWQTVPPEGLTVIAVPEIEFSRILKKAEPIL